MTHCSELPRWRRWAILLVLAVSGASAAGAVTVSVDLYVRGGTLETTDGRSLPVLCYAGDGTGPARLPNPEISLQAGDELQVTLHNQDAAAHGFEIVGLVSAGSSVAPGTSQTFGFLFPDPGCWLYRDPVDTPVNQGLGLAGAVVVGDPGSTHDGEFLWLLNEHSETWLLDHQAGQPVDDAVYLPNYFTVNGLSGLDTLGDPRATVAGRVGDSLLIHAVNGGLRLHSIHFHGYHVQLLWRDGAALASPWEKDTVAIPAGGTALFLLTPHQPGLFPIHDHVVQSVTADGVYPLGMIVFADIQP